MFSAREHEFTMNDAQVRNASGRFFFRVGHGATREPESYWPDSQGSAAGRFARALLYDVSINDRYAYDHSVPRRRIVRSGATMSDRRFNGFTSLIGRTMARKARPV